MFSTDSVEEEFSIYLHPCLWLHFGRHLGKDLGVCGRMLLSDLCELTSLQVNDCFSDEWWNSWDDMGFSRSRSGIYSGICQRI